MIIEAAIGDAYGAGFEYTDQSFIQAHHDLEHYQKHPRHKLGEGRYTDDTEMTTAVAEAMLEGDLTIERLANWFVRAFHRERRVGYANRFYQFLCTLKTGAEFLDHVAPDSDKSGAAMRGWIVGLYSWRSQVMDMARLQASITHNTTDGIAAAQAAAMMMHFFAHHHGTHRDVAEYVADHVPGPWTEAFHGPVGPKGIHSVHAALQAIVQHGDLAGILRCSVDYGGDVDTVATIALGCASMASDVVNNLPQNLHDGLEDGPWGRDYLLRLDARLAQRFLPARMTTPND